MSRLSRLACRCMLVSCVATTSVEAQARADSMAARPPVVAVLDFTNGSLVDHDAYAPATAAIAALLLGELQGHSGLRLVERERIEDVLAELDFGRSGRIAAATAARAGHLLGAEYVITGILMVDRSGSLRIDARAVDVETAIVVYGETVVGVADDLIDAVGRLGARLRSTLVLQSRFPADPSDEDDTRLRARTRADLNYARALREEDRRNARGALEQYQAFLSACPAGYALDRQAHARSRIAVLSSSAAR